MHRPPYRLLHRLFIQRVHLPLALIIELLLKLQQLLDPHGECLGRVCRIIEGKTAAVGVVQLLETHFIGAPREDFALQATASLWDAVNRWASSRKRR